MKRRPTILIADDIDITRQVITNLLEPMGYAIIEAGNGEEALDLALRERPDIILLDLAMPRMGGLEVCKIIKSNPETRAIPIVVITGLTDEETHLKALEAGADGFLTKPFKIHFLKTRLKALLSLKMLNDIKAEYQDKLKKSNIELMQKLIKAQDVTIFALAKLAEFRDPDTGHHLERMREYAKSLALGLREMSLFKDYITDQYIDNLYKSTPLHDIGKVGIPDRILLKPAALTKKEFEIMKKHTEIGGEAISAAIKFTGMESTFLDMGKNIAYYHHEKWNGAGYPKGLTKEDIPLSARITAFADVYDALTTKRVYKHPFSHETSKRIILEEAGKHFDPHIVEAFLRYEQDFMRIKTQLYDNSDNVCYYPTPP